MEVIWVYAALTLAGCGFSAVLSSWLWWRSEPHMVRLHQYAAATGFIAAALTLAVGMLETSYRWRT